MQYLVTSVTTDTYEDLVEADSPEEAMEIVRNKPLDQQHNVDFDYQVLGAYEVINPDQLGYEVL